MKPPGTAPSPPGWAMSPDVCTKTDSAKLFLPRDLVTTAKHLFYATHHKINSGRGMFAPGLVGEVKSLPLRTRCT